MLMQPLKVLLSIPFPFSEDDHQAILQACPNAQVEYIPGELQEDLDAVDGREFHVVVSEWAPSDLAKWQNLRLVQLLSAGINQLPAAHPVWSSDVQVATASGIHSVPMAQFGIGALLSLTHRMPQLNEFQRTRQWPDRNALACSLLRDKTVGIVGYGSIGRECARLAHAMGMAVLALKRDPHQKEDNGFNAWPGTGDPKGKIPRQYFASAQISEMLPQCDAVIVTAPRSSETEGLIGGQELRQMKPTATVIVLSRGGIVDESALCQALHEGWIAGAAVDAFVQEPLPADSPLFDAPNIILTPHMSGVYDTYWDMTLKLLCENLRRISVGQKPFNLADGAKGY